MLRRSIRYYCFCWLSIFASLSVLRGQELRFRHYTTDDGLSLVATHSPGRTLQDREGFMWFATMDGVVRFDGVHFKIYKYSVHDPYSIGSNQTTAICEAADGKIWVGTGAEGIYVFDPLTERFSSIHHDPGDPNSLAGDGINFLATARDGAIWIGTRFNGICKYLPDPGRFISYASVFNDGECFYQQEDGTIWLGSGKGLARYIAETDQFELFSVRPEAPADWMQNVIFDIAEDRRGRLWLSSNFHGLNIFDPGPRRFVELPASVWQTMAEDPNAVCADREGNIWLSGLGGVYQYRPDTEQTIHYRHDPARPATSAFQGRSTDIFLDRTGSLWFTNPGSGIAVLHTAENPFQVIAGFGVNSLVAADSQTILLGAPSGLYSFQLSSRAVAPFPFPQFDPTHQVGQVLSSRGNRLWVVDQSAVEVLRYWDRQSGKTGSFFNGHRKYAVDTSGTIWRNDLHYLDGTSDTWVDVLRKRRREGRPDMLLEQQTDIVIDAKNRVWIASDKNGLYRYDPASDSLSNYMHSPRRQNSLLSNIVYDLHAGADGKIYAATINGLSILDPKQDTFIQITAENGLPHDHIQAITEDASGAIWISTTDALSRLRPPTWEIDNYTVKDGIPDSDFLPYAAYCDPLGFLYFSTVDKTIRFHPEQLHTDTVTAPVYLAQFFLNHEVIHPFDSSQVLSQPIRYVGALQLHYDQNDFGFSFVMPTFRQAEKNHYQYRLEGYNDGWQAATGREAHFTNIDPGRYVFRVRAFNSSGFPGKQEAALLIVIAPPWWRTWWAYGLFGSIVAFFFWGVYRFTLTRQLAKAEARRLQELDAVKTRLYTNITHEFRTPLTVIMGIANQIRGHSEERELIRRNSLNMLRLVNQLLDLSKLDAGSLALHFERADLVRYLHYLTESLRSLAAEKQIEFAFHSEVQELVMDFDAEKIQQIIFNLLSNAIKFTPEGGRVDLRIRRLDQHEPGWLELAVSDTGAGIPAGDLPHVFDRFYQVENVNTTTRTFAGTGIGLALTKELVALMGGKIGVESEVGRGTTFSIHLPVGQETGHRKPVPERQPFAEVPPFPVVEENHDDSLAWMDAGSQGEQPALLVIEDNRDVVTYIKRLLQKQYRIEVAHDGQEGIDKAFHTIPDIIISDIMMPEMDGYRVCEILKSDERTSHIPIILLTAKASDEARIAGLQTGADAYLLKPFHKKELLVRLEKLVLLRRRLQEKYGSAETLFSRSAAQHQENTLETQFLVKLREAVEANLDNPDFGVPELCAAAHLSHAQVFRKLKALTAQSPSVFIRTIRLYHAQKLLQNTSLNISEIAYQVGFTDPNYFTRTFTETFGSPPTQLRK